MDYAETKKVVRVQAPKWQTKMSNNSTSQNFRVIERLCVFFKEINKQHKIGIVAIVEIITVDLFKDIMNS